ncbi:MAG: glycosyltransferase family 2 protein [Acidobacteriota bacterium]
MRASPKDAAGAASRNDPGSAASSRTGTGISIVICSKDRADELQHAVASIRSSGKAGCSAEIVIVEETASPRSIPDVKYIHLTDEGRGFGHARNLGVRQTSHDLVLFIDDDCEAEAGWVEALSAPLLEDPELLGVAGSVRVRDCNLIGYAENILGFPGGGLRYLHQAQERVVPTRYLSTCNCAYRRRAIERAGGFPEDAAEGGEDFLLAERVCTLGRCAYARDAAVYHRPRGNLRAIFRWFARRGRSEWLILARGRNRFDLLRSLLRSSWTLRSLATLIALLLWPRLALLLPFATLTYYGAILWRFRFARLYPSHRRAWWLVPIVKLTMDLGTEAGRWQALTGRR